MHNENELYAAANPEIQYQFRPNLFMWPGRTLFIGPLQKLALHSMGSTAINVGLYQPFQIRTENGSYKACRCAVIPAGCKHEINAGGNIVASLIIEKNSPEYAVLKNYDQFTALQITRLMDSRWITCFQKIYEEKPTKCEIDRLVKLLLPADTSITAQIDPRIDSVMHTIQQNPGNNSSQELLAASVALSCSRFRHLFREQSDVPYRRYRMWRRVVSAMNALHKIDSLTHAAMQAGFSDAAHFNRCFRDSLGVNPSLVFRNIDRFEV
jgi:AraC-like DNA-binding protein